MLYIKPEIPDTPDIRQYHAIFTQTGTAHPDVTVLHNTMGDIQYLLWTRTNLGVYTLTSVEGEFTANKTIIQPYGADGSTLRMAFTKVGTGSQPQMFIRIARDSSTDIVVRCYTATSNHTLKEYSDVGGPLIIMINVYK